MLYFEVQSAGTLEIKWPHGFLLFVSVGTTQQLTCSHAMISVHNKTEDSKLSRSGHVIGSKVLCLANPRLQGCNCN